MAALPIANGIDDNQNLVDILVSQGALNSVIGDRIKMAQVQTGKDPEDLIKEQNLVTETALTKAKATFFNVPYLDLDTIPISPDALSFVTSDIAQRFRVFPVNVDRTKNELTLAMADPLDLSAIEFIEQKTNLHVRPQAADASKIDEFTKTRYEASLSQKVTEALEDVSQEGVKTLDAKQEAAGNFVRGEKIGEIVSDILDFAVRSRASDIHIEPEEKAVRVRYRIDGILQEKLTIPKRLQEPLLSKIKILAGMKIIEKRIPQDGRFNFRSGNNEEVDLRVSTLPTAWGEKVVMRLLKKTGGIPDLPELGLRGHALKNLEDAILRPHGIILICGPTGSGKTTTLYSIIQRINTPKINIMTLEDPIEYKIAGVNQVQINPDVGLTFASGLRAFLRQDPNVILVGEIRDRETADLAIQASLTGHLVFATLHTNDAAGALPRLLDMGAEPFLITSSITAIVAQRVLRKIDENGKVAYDPDLKVLQQVKDGLGTLYQPKSNPVKFFKGTPSPENNNSGYLGRVGIYEVLPVTEKISRLILERAPAGQIAVEAKNEGMITLEQDGFLKVLDGTTTVEEVLRVAQE
ncbi:MAG TPA: GspE/PulE family protein [Patescibacteria group bacterium]|nr:GspE/PulE family protein [Patescibacteria group bacterium]